MQPTSIKPAQDLSRSRNDIVYFELNNWFAGEQYPDEEPFKTWCGNDEHLYFDSDRWCRENGLVVTRGIIDMSINWCISATREWIESHCPALLSKFTEFLRPKTESIWGQPFKEYKPENIGLHVCDEDIRTGEWEFYTRDEILDKIKLWDEDIYGSDHPKEDKI